MKKRILTIIFAVIAAVASCAAAFMVSRRRAGRSDDSGTSGTFPSSSSAAVTTEKVEWQPGTDMTRNDAFWALRRNNGCVRFMDTDNYTGRIRLSDKNGNEIDLDRCSEVPCKCGVDRYMLIFGATVCTLSGLPEENNIFYVYDISETSDVKWQRLSVEGLAQDQCDIIYNAGNPFYYLKEKRTGSSWTVLDMSDAVSGVIKKLDFPAYADDKYIPLLLCDEKLYCATRKSSAYTAIYVADADSASATLLCDLPSSAPGCSKLFLTPGPGESIYLFIPEKDEESVYGLSLRQYTFLIENGKVLSKSVIRRRDICDLVVVDNAIYYTVNSNAGLTELPDRDKSEGNTTFLDMSGGRIYRQPISGGEEEVIYALGDGYHLYGYTYRNLPLINGYTEAESSKVAFQNTFVQAAGSSLSFSAVKSVGGRTIHTQLTLTVAKDGVTVTETEGSRAWGRWLLADWGGGTSFNWGQRPE